MSIILLMNVVLRECDRARQGEGLCHKGERKTEEKKRHTPIGCPLLGRFPRSRTELPAGERA